MHVHVYACIDIMIIISRSRSIYLDIGIMII